MRAIFLLFVPFAALTSLACGGSVDSASTGTSGSGGSSSGTSSATSSGSGGGATTSSTSGTGGGSACSGFIDVTEQGGAPQHFASICEGSWGSSETMTAVGYHFSGGVSPGLDEIQIGGCAGPGNNAPGLHLTTPKVTAPGTFMDGSATYTDANGGSWSTAADPYQVVITKLDGPGGVIEGTFTGSVTGPMDGKKSLTGSFHVCRVADENAP
jgi:hypothetical protein